MSNKIHLVSFVLDESSSMQVQKVPTISGFNEWMETMEQFPGDIRFTMMLFNSAKQEILYKEAVLDPDTTQVRLNVNNYRPYGSTPLYDAIGKLVRETEELVDRLGPENTTVTFVILTDGQENSSEEFTLEGIQSLIKEKEKESDWTFTYLAAAPEAWDAGYVLGISAGNIMKSTFVTTQDAYRGHALSMTQHLVSGGLGSSAFYAGVTDADGQLIDTGNAVPFGVQADGSINITEELEDLDEELDVIDE